MFFSCKERDKAVSIWDLREEKIVRTFKTSLDDIKGVEVMEGDMLYVYGKSVTDFGACNYFDIKFQK